MSQPYCTSRLPIYTPTASDHSRQQWKLMQRELLSDPPLSKNEIEENLSKLQPKRAVYRRIVLTSQTGNLKQLRRLLWAHRRVNLNKTYGPPQSAKLTPLCWAALNGHVSIVECLLDGTHVVWCCCYLLPLLCMMQ